MAGLMPRRRAVDRLASAAARRAPVGLGTPGVRLVQRRDYSRENPQKTWLFEGVVEDIVPAETDYPYFIWDETKSC